VIAGSRWRDRRVTALTGALVVQCLLRGSAVGFLGLPTLLGLLALTPVVWSGYTRARTRERRIGLGIAIGVATVSVVLATGAAVTVLSSRTSFQNGADHATAGLDRLREGDSDAAGAAFRAGTADFDEASSTMEGWIASGARVLPVVGQHVEALRRVADSGAELGRNAATTASSADYRELTANAGQVDLAKVAALQAPVRESAATIAAAQDSVSAVSSPWLLPPVADELQRFADKLGELEGQASQAALGLAVAPELLGGNGARRYLIAFGTPAETRNGGGFVGSYGVLDASGGKVDLTEAGNLNDLNPPPPSVYSFVPPRDWQERYGGYHVDAFLGNLAESPNWPTNVEVISQLFPQTPGGTPLDGAIYADTEAVAGILELTGPVAVPAIGRTLDASNVEQFLLVDQYVEFDPLNPARKDLLSDVANAAFDALTSRSLPGISKLTETLGPLVAGGHLRLSVANDASEAFLDQIGLSGAWSVEPASDFLSVRSANSLTNKIDSFIHRDVDVATSIDPVTGQLVSTVTVTVHNDAPSSGLPTYLIGNKEDLPPGTSRDLVTVHTPHRLTDVTIDGRPDGWATQTEFGAPVYTAVAQAPPGGSTTVEFRLVGRVDEGPYRLQVIPQPMATPDRMSVEIRTGDALATDAGPLDRTITVTAAGRTPADHRLPTDLAVLCLLLVLGALSWFVVRQRQG